MCTDASLKSGYVTVTHHLADGGVIKAYGGNQNDFYIDSEHSTMSDLIIRNGGCALIAICDCSLYLSNRLNINADEYLSYVRDFSKKHLRPMSAIEILRKLIPKIIASDAAVINMASKFTKGMYALGTFYFKLCNAFNEIYSLNAMRMYRVPLNRLFVKKIKRALAASLADDIPAVLLLGYGSHATAVREERGKEITACIGWHYMTVTGVRVQCDGRTVITLSSWGKRMEACLEDLSRDSGIMGSMLLIKKVNKEAHDAS